jgi:hypothetical protein
MQFLKKFHNDEYTQKMYDFVPQFSQEYPSLFNMIISGSDLNMLDLFLDNLTDIDSGKKTLDDTRDELAHILHNKYVKNQIKK